MSGELYFHNPTNAAYIIGPLLFGARGSAMGGFPGLAGLGGYSRVVAMPDSSWSCVPSSEDGEELGTSFI